MILAPEGLVRYIRADNLAAEGRQTGTIFWGPDNKPLELLAVVLIENGMVRIDGISVATTPHLGDATRRRRRTGLRTSFTVPTTEPIPVAIEPNP